MNYNQNFNCSLLKEKQSDTTTYREYARARREKVFSVFTSNTDSKNYTVKVAGAFLDNYLPGLIDHLSNCDIVDLGTGNGYLSQKTAEYMHGKCIDKIINYQGIEARENSVDQTISKLKTLDYVNGKIIQGDCFGSEVDQLVNQPVLLIASHVVYYLKDLSLNEFIDKIFNKMGLVSIIIAQAEGSVLNKVIGAYAGAKGTENYVEVAISTHNVNFSHIKILYSSTIIFPKKISQEKLLSLAQADFEALERQEQEIRSLLEFSAGISIEELFCSDSEKLAHLISDLYTNMQLNEGNICFWSYMQITVPKDKMNQESMKLEMAKINDLMLSGNITSFERAIAGGDYEIAIELHKQGVMSCKIHQISYSYITEIFKMIDSYLRYELRLSSGWPEILGYFFNLDERTQFRDYSSPELLRIQNIKYNYLVTYGLPNPAIKANNLVESEGSSFRAWAGNSLTNLASYPFLYEFAASFILFAASFKIIPSSFARNGLSLGMLMVYNSFWSKFFYTSNSAIHYIKGDDFLFQLYLLNKTNLESLRFQNSEGQTALHKAILSKDTTKIHNLLSCDNSIVNNIINIKDSRGKIPLHNAIEADMGDNIIEILIEKSTAIDISTPSIIADFLFFGGKFIYLYAYFIDWIKEQKPYQIRASYLRLATLTSLYTLTSYFDIKLLDKIYYFTFAHRLNYYDNWKESSSSNHIQDKYSCDTALHLSVKHNREAVTRQLLARNDTKINALNIKGESALHLAAANNNTILIDLLLKNGANINIQANLFNSVPIYLLGDFTIKAFSLYCGANNLLSTIAEIIFISVIRDELFGSFQPAISPAPIHYATSIKTTTKLIENGANPEATITYYGNAYLQIIPYLAAKSFIKLAAILFQKEISNFYALPLLLIPVFLNGKKPTELINHQYDVVDKQTEPLTLLGINPEAIAEDNFEL